MAAAFEKAVRTVSSIFGFILLIMFVILVAAFGMWAAQFIAVKVGKKAPLEFEDRAAAPLSGDEQTTHHRSPDGRFDLITAATEMKMSHWIEIPTLVEVKSGRIFFALGLQWSADVVTWSDDSRVVTIQLRKYPGDVPGVTLAADLLSGDAHFTTRAGDETTEIPEIEHWLTGYIRRFGT
jgi:hypothetical protein